MPKGLDTIDVPRRRRPKPKPRPPMQMTIDELVFTGPCGRCRELGNVCTEQGYCLRPEPYDPLTARIPF